MGSGEGAALFVFRRGRGGRFDSANPLLVPLKEPYTSFRSEGTYVRCGRAEGRLKIEAHQKRNFVRGQWQAPCQWICLPLPDGELR